MLLLTWLKRYRWWLALAAVVAIPVASVAFTIVAGPVGYGGRLLTTAGAPVADGTYDFAFRIYDADTAGTKLYEQTATLTVDNGYFNVFLNIDNTGGAVVIDDVLTAAGNRFLEVQVDTDILSPRQLIGGVPWALRSRL
jgi:hypothetical protein